MEDIIERINCGDISFTDEKMRAAYALNLCTVSVSQIIEYNDVNILEQEYEAILNNLNIEKMPKDEALLNILKQLMDTITFFRIQEGDKEFIDREYQNKMKNAIWNAVPNIGLIVAGGNPYTMLASLVSQVGIGYMNYRKAKAENGFAYEKELWQLHRAAIEQFNGLRRELFDTAWRLAAEYNFPDNYRLTERQVKQYDAILMDSDMYRKYERLNTIKESFVAYPPFWYFFGNTANEISRNGIPEEADEYSNLAKQYFEIFIQAYSKCSLLRENQIAASCALEYISLLDADEDVEKIKELLSIAVKSSGNANDVLQMCSFAYLKIGDVENATRILNILVNEDYNSIVNGQLLSKIYFQSYVEGNTKAITAYKKLCTRVEADYLYQLPSGEQNIDANQLMMIENSFVEKQKEILVKKYGIVINRYQEKYRVLFNRCVLVPNGKERFDSYYNGSTESYALRKQDGLILSEKRNANNYVDELERVNYPYNYLPILNQLLKDVYELNCVQGFEGELSNLLQESILSQRNDLLKYKNYVEEPSKFSIEAYNELIKVSFDDYTKSFFERLSECVARYLEGKNSITSMNDAETNLRDFCKKQGFESPERLYDTDNDIVETEDNKIYLGMDLIDFGVKTEVIDEDRLKLKNKVKEYKNQITVNAELVEIYLESTEEFEKYFINLEGVPGKREIQRKTVAILDDKTDKDNDLLFTVDGVIQVRKGKMKCAVEYSDIELNINSKVRELLIQGKYVNENINMDNLIKLFFTLSPSGNLRKVDKFDPVKTFNNILKK